MQLYQHFEILFWKVTIPLLRALAIIRRSLGVQNHLRRWDKKATALGITAIVCAAATAGILLFSGEDSRSNRGVSPANAPLKVSEQRNLLVIGVNHLNAKQPVLQSAWLVLYIPGLPNFTFVPLYPSQDHSSPDLDRAIQQTFKVNRDRSPSASFLRALRSTGAWWNNYIVMDGLALAEIIDLSSTANFPERITGLQLVAKSLAPNGAPSPIAGQANLIATACRGFVFPPAPQDIDVLLDRFSNHLHTDLRPGQIMSDLLWLNGLDQSTDRDSGLTGSTSRTISCEFPTINHEITFVGGQLGYP